MHATSDGVLLAFHDDALDRVTDSVGLLGELTAEQVSLARIADLHAIPTMAELLEEFPGCRFNIDLKSDAAVGPLVELLDRAAAHDRVCVGSFSGRRIRAFRPRPAAGWPRRRPPPRWPPLRFRLPSLPRPGGRSGPPCCRSRGGTSAGGSRVTTPGFVRRAHARACTCTCGPARRLAVGRHRRPGEHGDAARHGRGRTDHRPHRPAQGSAHQARTMEAGHHEHLRPARHRRPLPDRPAPAAEGLELVRLGQLGVLHDRALGAVRAVHDHRRRQGRRLRRPRRDLQQDGLRAGPAPRRRLAARAT